MRCGVSNRGIDVHDRRLVCFDVQRVSEVVSRVKWDRVAGEMEIQMEQRFEKALKSNFDPIDDDLPGVIPRKFRWF